MGKISEGKLARVLNSLEKKKVFTLDSLVSFLSCAIPTARLKLKQWGTYTSYNQNGRYYTMPSIPRFDDNGLWHYKEIYFSQYGNLKNTVIELVSGSSFGLTGKEIGTIVRLDPRSFLHHFRNTKGIQREKRDGVFVYYASDPVAYDQQKKRREMLEHTSGEFVSDADAVIILCALINNYGISFEAIMALSEIRMHQISPIAIRNFLEHHGLIKKTPATKR
jgi:hypothetical protein